MKNQTRNQALTDLTKAWIKIKIEGAQFKSEICELTLREMMRMMI